MNPFQETECYVEVPVLAISQLTSTPPITTSSLCRTVMTSSVLDVASDIFSPLHF